jgi:CheY-like chemotaxis protein
MMERMSETTPRVLIVGRDAPALRRIVPLLRRNNFEVVTVGSGEGALGLVRGEPFQLVVVHFPLGEPPFSALLSAVRDPRSPCRHAGMLLLVPPHRLDEANAYVGKGVNRVVALDCLPEQLLHAVADLIGVAPRVALRAVVQLEVRVTEGRDLTICQTENISLSGILVRGAGRWAPGTKLGFELTLPGLSPAIRGAAEVVRRTVRGREGIEGTALKIVSFAGNGQELVERFLAKLAR